MKSKAKYKGKYTKKRLKNFVRGTTQNFCADAVKRREKFQAVLWQNRGCITKEQRIQWGYF